MKQKPVKQLSSKHESGKQHVTTALLLAAGTGSRLYPITQDAPKCLTVVNGRTILDRLVDSLKLNNFKRLIIVTGYLENLIRDKLGNSVEGMTVEYVYSPQYETTNNIVSLWMAKELIDEPFLLLESDLVFDPSLLAGMLYPNKIAVAKMQPWMNGSCVTINKYNRVNKFLAGAANSGDEIKYKTVNIYSISLLSWLRIVKILDQYISDSKVNEYYEVVFAEMVADSSLSFERVSFDGSPWYEIDTVQDLTEGERQFALCS